MASQVTDFSFWNEMWKQSYYDREKGIRANPLLEYWDKRANDFSLMWLMLKDFFYNPFTNNIAIFHDKELSTFL